jgi:hypothetical protein
MKWASMKIADQDIQELRRDEQGKGLPVFDCAIWSAKAGGFFLTRPA